MKKTRVVDHDEILRLRVALLGQNLIARHVDELDRHAARVSFGVVPRGVFVAVRKADPRLVALARHEDTLRQIGLYVLLDLEHGPDAAVRLGVRITKRWTRSLPDSQRYDQQFAGRAALRFPEALHLARCRWTGRLSVGTSPSQPDPSSTTRASSGSKALYQSEKSRPIAPGDYQLAQVEERTRPARL